MGLFLNTSADDASIPPWVIFAFIGLLLLLGLGLILSFYLKVQKPRYIKKVAKRHSVLANAEVEVHFVSSARRPRSGDKYYFYSIEATITPKVPMAQWDPNAIAVVPLHFVPASLGDVQKYLDGFHSTETCVDGCFVSTPEGGVVGSRRVRFLFAIGKDVRAVKFANRNSCFGYAKLPKVSERKPIVAKDSAEISWNASEDRPPRVGHRA